MNSDPGRDKEDELLAGCRTCLLHESSVFLDSMKPECIPDLTMGNLVKYLVQVQKFYMS